MRIAGSDARGAEEFAALMGTFGQTVNSISFVFSLVGFSLVVRWLGLPKTLMLFPALLTCATLVTYAFPSLQMLFVTTALLKALTYSLNEPAIRPARVVRFLQTWLFSFLFPCFDRKMRLEAESIRRL